MDYADRLTLALAHALVRPAALADAVGITVQAISQVLSRKTKALTAENSAKAARFLGVDVFWLATGEGEMRPAVADHMALTQEERDVIIAMRVLTPEERDQVMALIVEKAGDRVAQLEALILRQSERQAERPNDSGSVVPIRR